MSNYLPRGDLEILDLPSYVIFEIWIHSKYLLIYNDFPISFSIYYNKSKIIL